MAISDWPAARRPRERLLAEGAKKLHDAELLAVLLRTGVRGKSAVDLGHDLLKRFGSINRLLAAGPELLDIKGLGEAKSAQFSAAIELARRAMEEELKERSALTSPGAVRDYLRVALGHRRHEIFVCIWLDEVTRRNNEIHFIGNVLRNMPHHHPKRMPGTKPIPQGCL